MPPEGVFKLMTTQLSEIPSYYLDPVYITNIKIEKSVVVIDDIKNPKNEVIEIRKGSTAKIIGHEAHPEFKRLRTQLIDARLIKPGLPGTMNTDRVLKPFILNSCLFLPSVRFSSPASLANDLLKRHLNPRRGYYPENLREHERAVADAALAVSRTTYDA